MHELGNSEVGRMGVNALVDSTVGRIGVIVHHGPGLRVSRVSGRVLASESTAPRARLWHGALRMA